MTCHLVASSDSELKFIFSGQTWAFRDAMDEALGNRGMPEAPNVIQILFGKASVAFPGIAVDVCMFPVLLKQKA